MPKPKVLVYSLQNSQCNHCRYIFNNSYYTEFVFSKNFFFQKIKNINPDIGILCLCSADQENAEEIASLKALVGPLPLLVCSKTLSVEFVSAASQLEINSFLMCNWDKYKIEDIILHSIHCGWMRKYFESSFHEEREYSPYISKIITYIIHAFPKRLHELQIAKKLGISVSWLQKLFRRSFKLSYSHFLRRIWIRQALCLMKYTNMDNTEIAMYLNYTEESSMARDFRKELGLNPTQARQKLIKLKPEELIHYMS